MSVNYSMKIIGMLFTTPGLIRLIDSKLAEIKKNNLINF